MTTVPAGSSAYPVGVCVVVVGGRWLAGGRVCGDTADEHNLYGKWCAACRHAGIPSGNAEGPGKGHAGWDHAFYSGPVATESPGG